MQFRFLLCWLVCMTLHLFLYFGSQYWEGEPHTVGWRLDERIPVVPGFIYIYCSWFLMLVLVPLALYRADPVTALRYLLADVFDQFISFAVFMLYPTTFDRPAPAGKGLTHLLFRIVYGANHRFLNCIPSVHCSASMLFILAALRCPLLPGWQLAAIAIMALLIIVSTVLVKQHMLIDVLTAVPTAVLAWWLSGLPNVAALAQYLKIM